jgi:hypothetical protein
MKKILLAALCAVLSACGDDKAADPSSVKFQYGTPEPVTTGSDAEYAAAAGADAFSDALLVSGETDPATAQTRTGSVMSLPDAMASEVMDSTYALTASAGSTARTALAARVGRFAAPALLDACVTIAPGRITYDHCTETETYTEVDGTYTMTATMNGWFTFTISGGNQTLDWDLDVSVKETGPEMSFTTTNRYTGALAIGPTTLDGNARSDMDARISMSGYGTIDFALTHLADYDLDFQAEPFCFTDGTLELRRVWRERPSGYPSEQLPDQGVLFTFGPGCGVAQMAWGSR